MYLNDVSCPDTTDCTAVGSFGSQGVGGPSVISITIGTNGQADSSQVSYYQGSNSYIGSFTSISCPSTGNCLAVGYTYDDSGNFHPAYAQETSGVWGDVQQVATPAGDSNNESFTGVSCVDANDCVAVGNDEYTSTSSIIPIADSFNSGVWGTVAELTTPTSYGYLYDVSCVDSSDCTAVGTDDNANNVATAPIEITLTGGVWGTAAELSSSDPTVTILKSISCVDSMDCTAVGQSNDINDGYSNVDVATETNVGGQGTWGSVVNLGQQGVGRMFSVSCVDSQDCTAVGWDDLNQNPLYSIESAGTWGPFSTVNTGDTAYFYGVGCAQSQLTESCIAVGENSDGSLVGQPFGSQAQIQRMTRASGSSSAVKGAVLMSTRISRLPSAPTNIAVTVPASGSLAVTWKAPTLTGSRKVSSYTVSVTTAGHTTTYTTLKLSYRLNGLSSFDLYTIKVSATNAIGRGPVGQALYQVYPVTATKPHLKVLPDVVTAGVPFKLLTYGVASGTPVTFTEQGSSYKCTVNSLGQCWVNAVANKTGVWKARVTIKSSVLTSTFQVRS